MYHCGSQHQSVCADTMFFQIENTPKRIRRSRRVETVREEQKPEEEISRLVIGPFSNTPHVVFENVLIGSTCERELEVFNPSKLLQEITLAKPPPEGLVIHLPEKCLTLEPETCYRLKMQWTPMQPTAARETIRFTDQSRGSFDVIVVLMSAMDIKGKGSQKATLKTSPGKMKRKASHKKSPGENTTKIMKTVHEVKTSVGHNVYSQKSPNKENMSRIANDDYVEQELSNRLEVPVPRNVLKSSNRQNFERFTPLKSAPAKAEKLGKGPNISLSMNCDSDYDDSLNLKYENKENAPHSVICITSTQEPTKCLTADLQKPFSISNVTFEKNKSVTQNVTLNHTGNVYTQSLTVNPFSSSTYDEEAVDKFETEFKRWLNYILTPPIDLESNIEQKIDLGKAWIENRNKEVPLAPTKEQVCSNYHNSHRLASVRRAAKALLMSPEIAQVLQKLNAQIEKKQIAIRTDRNLHLDVGLQKIIMEVLLSYNPLWLRIGLEAIYGIILPLKSNSDIKGLTMFIIHSLFKNPHLKNKHSKSRAPIMFLPAYMDAIKKFTLKKFFMLVFFLDQAKQKKLIPHDPCLFCKNAICKESRNIIISFTRELIAGIGDITRHLRPLGYVVSHKQSNLDEYKYAVHDIAVDMRDGVRLTKVMEIILIKNGLTNQLRTPAISRLQKIHNVQVALNALKDADFAIAGDITANDIADGHREKTLSLLFQLIHVFHAPLFETAAIVIQTWFRKKFQVIKAQRIEEERIIQQKKEAASLTQFAEKRKNAVKVIEERYIALMKMKKEKEAFLRLKRAVILAQSLYRGKKAYLEYTKQRNAIIQVQRRVRAHQQMKKDRANFLQLKKATCLLQSHVRAYLAMKTQRKEYIAKRHAAITIQIYFRSYLLAKAQRNKYLLQKNAAEVLQKHYRSVIAMRQARGNYIKLKEFTILIQRRYRALVLMRKSRLEYQKILAACLTIQRKFSAELLMRKERSEYLKLKSACTAVQDIFRARSKGKKQRQEYLKKKDAAITIQQWYRRCGVTKRVKEEYQQTKQACVTIQRVYRAYIIGKTQRQEYLRIRTATVCIQKYYRLYVEMKTVREQYVLIKTATVKIQKYYRAYVVAKNEREKYIRVRNAAIKIQIYYRQYKVAKATRVKYCELRNATICIQRRYRNYCLMKKLRAEYLTKKQASLTIQQRYKALLAMRKQRLLYQNLRSAALTIQRRYRALLQMREEMAKYRQIKTSCVLIQRAYRAYILGRKERTEYLRLKQASLTIQRKYKALLAMRTEREAYRKLHQATAIIQRRFRAKKMEERKLNRAASLIQALFRGHHVRTKIVVDRRVAELRRRWREGALRSSQETLKERNKEAMEVLSNMYDIESVIRAFRSLDFLSEVLPMMYDETAVLVTRRVFLCMSVTNRSISSVEVLKCAASVLVNLVRYRVTGPKIYARDHITSVLKFMLRFGKSETELFCIFCTYLWLFNKYDNIREDLINFLNMPQNHRMLVTIKANVDRIHRKSTRSKLSTPQSSKLANLPAPALEPDYGITKADKPRYFNDAYQAIICLFSTFNL